MMLQLGAIKKIRKNFFSRVLVLSGIERGKNYGKRFILNLKARNQISHQGFFEEPIYQKYLHDPRKLFTQRP